MILRSFIILIFFSINFLIPNNHSYAKDPLSAIDWLAEKINDPPNFYSNSLENTFNNNAIKKMDLPNVSNNSIGIFPSIRVGLNADLWKKNNEIEIVNKLNEISINDIYFFNRFYKRILLIEADPPLISNNVKFSGSLFLRARILKLIEMGALDDAEALIIEANPSKDSNLIDLWSQISFLTFRLDRFCHTILKGYHSNIKPSHKIICLARSGDWNAAALTLATYSSINEIKGDYEKLLINYLDNEAELEINNTELCSNDVPLIIYLCNFSKRNSQNSIYKLKYLYGDLNRGKSIRSRINASEELVKSGALNPNVLFSNYKVNQPSTSGGIWARTKLIQDLEKKLENEAIDDSFLSNHLSLIIENFLKNNLISPFAEYYSERLNKIISENTSLNEQIIVFGILSGNYTNLISKNKKINTKLKKLIDVISSRDEILISTNRKHNFHENNVITNNYTDLQKIILEASTGGYQYNKNIKSDIEEFSNKQTGLLLLNSLKLISSGINSELIDLQKGLVSLVNLGLKKDFKAISNELLVLEYLKKL